MKIFTLLCFLMGTFFYANSFAAEESISLTYQLMDHAAFKETVVNHTVIGTTHHNQNIYFLYFAADGSCELWKQNHIYQGTWWIEKDETGKDFVRALWPELSSNATTVWYYLNPQQLDTLLIATKTYQVPVLLVSGRAFPPSN